MSLTICRMAQLVLDEAEKFLHPEGVHWLSWGVMFFLTYVYVCTQYILYVYMAIYTYIHFICIFNIYDIYCILYYVSICILYDVISYNIIYVYT